MARQNCSAGAASAVRHRRPQGRERQRVRLGRIGVRVQAQVDDLADGAVGAARGDQALARERPRTVAIGRVRGVRLVAIARARRVLAIHELHREILAAAQLFRIHAAAAVGPAIGPVRRRGFERLVIDLSRLRAGLGEQVAAGERHLPAELERHVGVGDAEEGAAANALERIQRVAAPARFCAERHAAGHARLLLVGQGLRRVGVRSLVEPLFDQPQVVVLRTVDESTGDACHAPPRSGAAYHRLRGGSARQLFAVVRSTR